MLYNIYAGLGGGFGGIEYKGTRDCCNYDDAIETAKELAVEEYGCYEEIGKVESWDDIAIDYLIDENIINNEDEFDTYELSEEDEENITQLYIDNIELWVDYYAIKTSEDDNTNYFKETYEYKLI